MKYYDVTYESPSKIIGIHHAVDAESVIEAASKSPEMLSYGTPWKPEEWTVLAVVPTPKDNEPVDDPSKLKKSSFWFRLKNLF
jgi:hypothetical protein